MTAAASAASMDALTLRIEGRARRQRLWTLAAFTIVAAYMAASFIQFDLGSIARKWNPDRASLFILDTYAHKDHVTMRWSKPDEVTVSFEGDHRRHFDPPPAWFARDAASDAKVVSFDNGGRIAIYSDRVEMLDWPGVDSDFAFRVDATGKPYVEGFSANSDALPDWMRATENKVEVRPSLYERLQVYGTKVEIHRYGFGWKYFWFDFDSPLVGNGLSDAIGLMVSGDRVDPARSNVSLVFAEFLDNDLWHHGTVLFALVETVLMALIGTMIASAIGLPLGFMAARNVAPLPGMRFALRRFFDFLRGIDVLIWSLIFLRAFGPGLFTGIFAIAFTDTGTLGKLMSEAIENADKKQEEGVQSTGARRIQRHRFGILPQILPVFISQSLYYLESNTRSAVIIGAMGAGGIGLQFLGALQTGSDFENVAYMAALVLAVVIAMDALSARLRRALIGLKHEA